MTDSPQRRDALRYKDGRFEPIYDPLDDQEESDLAEALSKMGYEGFFTIGQDDSPLYIETYRKQTDESWTYMMSVWDVHVSGPNIYVDDFGDLMDLISRWSAPLQTSALLYLVSELTSFRELGADGIVERLGARLEYGREHALPTIMSRDAESRERRVRQRRAGRES